MYLASSQDDPLLDAIGQATIDAVLNDDWILDPAEAPHLRQCVLQLPSGVTQATLSTAITIT